MIPIIHLVLYTVLVTSAIDLAVKSPLYEICVLAFIVPAEKIVKEIVEETGATTIKDMGKVMKIAKERIGTRADGKDISDAVKKILA